MRLGLVLIGLAALGATGSLWHRARRTLQQLPELAQRARDDLLHVGQREAGELGDLGSGEVGAVAQRQDLPVAVAQAGPARSSSSGEAPSRSSGPGTVGPCSSRSARCGGRAVAAVMVDQQVAGDREQPGALRGAPRIEPAPGAQRALERAPGSDPRRDRGRRRGRPESRIWATRARCTRARNPIERGSCRRVPGGGRGISPASQVGYRLGQAPGRRSGACLPRARDPRSDHRPGSPARSAAERAATRPSTACWARARSSSAPRSSASSGPSPSPAAPGTASASPRAPRR